MEVNPGYKQSEVGVIPEDWEVSGLQQACRETITYGIVQCGPHVRDGVPYIRVSDMDEPELTAEAMLRTSKSIASKFARSTVEEGDLVYALRGKLGEVRQVRAELVGANLTQGTARLSPNDRLASNYLVWAMRHPRTVRQAELEAKGTTFREITLADLRRIKVLVPPKSEQRAIAEALSDVDGLLGRLDRLIAKKRDLMQAAMQQLLTGQTRLPGFHGEWEVKTFHEVCQKIQDGTHFSPKLGGNDYLYVTSKNIRFGMLDMSTAERISAAEHFKIYARCDVKKGDLLLTKDGANTGNAALNPLDEPFSLLSSVAMLRFDSRRHSAAYFMYQILSDFGQRQIKDAMSGNAITRLTLQKIRALRFSVATHPEQTAIALVLSEMDGELAVLEQRREKTRALKQAMMQELLTGRTRLI